MTETRVPPQPGDVGTPGDYIACMRRLRTWSGLPGEEIATRLADVIAATDLDALLAGEILPRREVVSAFVAACGCLPEVQDEWLIVHTRLANTYGTGSRLPDALPGVDDAPRNSFRQRSPGFTPRHRKVSGRFRGIAKGSDGTGEPDAPTVDDFLSEPAPSWEIDTLKELGTPEEAGAAHEARAPGEPGTPAEHAAPQEPDPLSDPDVWGDPDLQSEPDHKSEPALQTEPDPRNEPDPQIGPDPQDEPDLLIWPGSPSEQGAPSETHAPESAAPAGEAGTLPADGLPEQPAALRHPAPLEQPTALRQPDPLVHPAVLGHPDHPEHPSALRHPDRPARPGVPAEPGAERRPGALRGPGALSELFGPAEGAADEDGDGDDPRKRRPLSLLTATPAVLTVAVVVVSLWAASGNDGTERQKPAQARPSAKVPPQPKTPNDGWYVVNPVTEVSARECLTILPDERFAPTLSHDKCDGQDGQQRIRIETASPGVHLVKARTAEGRTWCAALDSEAERALVHLKPCAEGAKPQRFTLAATGANSEHGPIYRLRPTTTGAAGMCLGHGPEHLTIAHTPCDDADILGFSFTPAAAPPEN